MAILGGSINGEESATVTFKIRTVQLDLNSTVLHQEVLTIGDPESTLGLVRVRAAAPNSTDFGMVVRAAGTVVIEGNSTVLQGTSPWVIAGNSTVVQGTSPWVIAGNSTVIQGTSPWIIAGNSTVVVASGNSSVIVTSGNSSVIITSGNSSVIVTSGTLTAVTTITNPVTIQGNSSAVQSGTWNIATVTAVTDITNPVPIKGNSTVIQGTSPWVTSGVITGPLSTVVPAANSSGVVVREAVPDLLTVASTVYTSTATSVFSSAATRGRVVAYSFTSTHTSPIELVFMQGSTMKWPLVLQAISSAISGANLAVACPGYLFQTVAGRPLSINTASTGVSIRAAISYYLAP